MSAEIAIKLTGTEYRELVKAIEIVASQRQSRAGYVDHRLVELRSVPWPETDRPVATEEEIAEYERLQLESDQLKSFFRAKRAFFA